MSDNPSAPLLGRSKRPASRHSNLSDESHENTPLLSRSEDTIRYDGTEDDVDVTVASPATSSLRSLRDQGRTPPSEPTDKSRRRWPTVVAVTILGFAVLAIIAGAFFAPAIVEEYAKESLVIEPTNLSIHSFTSTGVTVRVQASFRMDASRVKNEAVRNIGRFGTYIASKVESKTSKMEVFLPEYGNILIGTAIVPGVVVSIRNGQTSAIDFYADLEPGDIEGIRLVANDWLEGRLERIRVLGKADVALQSGLVPLGSQTIAESFVFEGQYLYHSFAALYFGEKTLA
jgi:hypothetical protein